MFFCRQLQVLVSFVWVFFAVSSMCSDKFKMRLLLVGDGLFSVIHAALADFDCVAMWSFGKCLLPGQGVCVQYWC